MLVVLLVSLILACAPPGIVGGSEGSRCVTTVQGKASGVYRRLCIPRLACNPERSNINGSPEYMTGLRLHQGITLCYSVSQLLHCNSLTHIVQHCPTEEHPMSSITIRIDDELESRIEAALRDVQTNSPFASTNKSTMVRALLKLGLDALDSELTTRAPRKRAPKKKTSSAYVPPTAPATTDGNGIPVWKPGDPT